LVTTKENNTMKGSIKSTITFECVSTFELPMDEAVRIISLDPAIAKAVLADYASSHFPEKREMYDSHLEYLRKNAGECLLMNMISAAATTPQPSTPAVICGCEVKEDKPNE